MKLYDNPDVEFVIPDTGGMLFVDNMMIPNGSQAYADAHMMMDYLYNLDVAVPHDRVGRLLQPGCRVSRSAFSQTRRPHATPATRALHATGGGRADGGSHRLKQLAMIHQYKILTEEEEATWNDLFNEVFLGSGRRERQPDSVSNPCRAACAG